VSGLLLDDMYPPSLGQKLPAAGLDTLAALDIEVGLASRSDMDVLAWAARNKRCVVTENVRDFVPLASTMPHDGIILVASRRFPRTGSGLARLSNALIDLYDTDEAPAPGEVVWLSSV
jgi:Domain of unknown function (DUF5615)